MTRPVHKRFSYRGCVMPWCCYKEGLALSHRWAGVTCKRCLAMRAGRARRAVR